MTIGDNRKNCKVEDGGDDGCAPVRSAAEAGVGFALSLTAGMGYAAYLTACRSAALARRVRTSPAARAAAPSDRGARHCRRPTRTCR